GHVVTVTVIGVPPVAEAASVTSLTGGDAGGAIEAIPDNGEYAIQAGDTLLGIAVRYGLDWQDIALSNNMGEDELLQIGRVIRLPGRGGTGGLAAATTPDVAAGKQTHTVRAGETLWTIAARFQIPWQDIAAVNGLGEYDLLQVGQDLKLPASLDEPTPVVEEPVADATKATDTPATKESSTDATSDRPAREKSGFVQNAASTPSYTVRGGDTLLAIALRNDVTWQELATANGLTEESFLQIPVYINDNLLPDGTRTAYRTCPLCEASCGLEITVKGDRVTRIRGDRDDVFSAGFLCPKGSTLKQLHDDPDRLRKPLVRRDGVHVEVEWEEAWHVVAEHLPSIIAQHGRESVGVYLGNPGAHNLSAMLYNRSLLTALGTRRRFSASTVDQMPRQVAAGYVFGTPVSVPVPDLDRTDYLVVIGANPYASNGSLCTAPDFPGRIERMRARGGTLVVLDPRRSRTAEEADRWLPIRPGTDALFLAAMVTALAQAGRIDPGEHVAEWLSGLDDVVAALAPFTPESVAAATGIAADEIRYENAIRENSK
ncbi:MAG: LysM peptidoglycan-binding domain-containing protein, partial [Actinomycetes bacterium]